MNSIIFSFNFYQRLLSMMYRTLPTSMESSTATNSSFPAKLLLVTQVQWFIVVVSQSMTLLCRLPWSPQWYHNPDFRVISGASYMHSFSQFIKNVFHFLSIIAHGLVLSNYLSEYTYSLARSMESDLIKRKFIATYETEPWFFIYRLKVKHILLDVCCRYKSRTPVLWFPKTFSCILQSCIPL